MKHESKLAENNIKQEMTKCQHKLLMGEENNQCKQNILRLYLCSWDEDTEKRNISERSKMASLSNIYIGVIGVPLALDNQ